MEPSATARTAPSPVGEGALNQDGSVKDVSLAGSLAAAWTLLGVGGLFGSATYRLGSRGLATIQDGLRGGEWAALILLTVVFVYGEGFRALERRWVPGLVSRADYLRREGGTVLRLLAPLHGLALIGTVGRTRVRAWMGTTAIVLAVLLVRSLPEPWRGIVDFAVASALAWGLVAVLRRAPSTLR
jgi:hypothetical protein